MWIFRDELNPGKAGNPKTGNLGVKIRENSPKKGEKKIQGTQSWDFGAKRAGI